MKDEMVDPVLVCFYCGDVISYPTENQMKFFDNRLPRCCDKTMATLDRNDLFKVSEGLKKLKEKIDEEIIRGIT